MTIRKASAMAVVALAICTGASADNSSLGKTRVRQILPRIADQFTHNSAYHTLASSASVTSTAVPLTAVESSVVLFETENGIGEGSTATITPYFTIGELPADDASAKIGRSVLGPAITIDGVTGGVADVRVEGVIYPNGATSMVLVVTNNDSASISFRLLHGGQ